MHRKRSAFAPVVAVCVSVSACLLALSITACGSGDDDDDAPDGGCLAICTAELEFQMADGRTTFEVVITGTDFSTMTVNCPGATATGGPAGLQVQH